MYTELYPVTYYFYPLLEGDYQPGAHQNLLESLLRTEPRQVPESLLYVHIPYCHDLCQFCPFHVKLSNDDDVYRRYAALLCREMELIARYPYVAAREFKAVYFGGGSPSILPVPQIHEVFQGIKRNFRLARDVEISFEGEPRTLGNPELLELLKSENTSRISFGLQTYDQVQRDRFEIAATLADVDRVTENGRRFGFDDINVDMMYDLPGQTIAMLEDDLMRLAAAGYDSVDYYNLHYYAFPKPFKDKQALGEIPGKPASEMHFALAQEIRWRMAELGYKNVADQIFSKKRRVCEYFRLLWGGGEGDHVAETVAVGSSARGYLQGIAYMNTGSVPAYAQAVEKEQLPVAKISSRLITPESRGAVFMPKFFRIQKKYRAAVESVPAELWKRWIESGLLRVTDEAYEITERGRIWTTNMMRDAFEQHQQQVAAGSLVYIEKKPGVRTGSF